MRRREFIAGVTPHDVVKIQAFYPEHRWRDPAEEIRNGQKVASGRRWRRS
jgi:hypothetical protein